MNKLLGTIFAALLLCAGVLLFAPGEVNAATGQELATTINRFDPGNGNGAGQLKAAWDSSKSTVTVTVADTGSGVVSGATNQLSLDIPSGITVSWHAEYHGSTNSSGSLILLPGNGTFDVATNGTVDNQGNGESITAKGGYSTVTVSGGTVSAKEGAAISAEGTFSTAIVSDGTVSNQGDTASPSIRMCIGSARTKAVICGSGKVQHLAASGGCAVKSWGLVEVKDTANISSASGYGVYIQGGSSSVTVSGGIVSTASGSAIYAYGATSAVTVSGSGKVQATASNGIAIRGYGTVDVKDSAEVSATSGNTIYSEEPKSKVTVSGSAKVKATADSGYAINTLGKVEVKDTAEVRTTKSRTIYAHGESSHVTVSGGTVSNESTYSSDPVIHMGTSASSMIDVSGSGKVRATANGGYAIASYGLVIVEDSAEVSATSGRAIYSQGSFNSVTVNGGVVSATSGIAIYAEGASSTVMVDGGVVQAKAVTGRAICAFGADCNVTVSSGMVFAYGDDITGTGNVINLLGYSSSFRVGYDAGVIAAWNGGATNYTAGQTDDIVSDPPSAKVCWSNNAANIGGIYYANSTTTGFIPLGVSVTSVAPDAPTVIASGSKGSITASWTPPFDGGDSIKGYSVQLNNNSPIRLGANVTQYRFDGLTDGATYTIKVVATNNVGSSTAGVTTATLPFNPVSFSLTLSTPPKYIEVGKSKTLVANTTPAKTAVVWKSGNTKIATVNSKTGAVKGKKAGTVYITAMAGGKSATVKVKIVSAVSRVHTPIKTIYLKKGTSAILPILGYAKDSTKPKLKWKSSNTKVATITQTGKIKTKKTGLVKITATAENGKKLTAKVKVVKNNKAVRKLIIKSLPKKKTMKKGQVTYLTVSTSPKTATKALVKWKTSNKKVISVNKAGVIVAKKKGTAKITAYVGKVKKTVTIKVK